jgi:hypothetical protein
LIRASLSDGAAWASALAVIVGVTAGVLASSIIAGCASTGPSVGEPVMFVEPTERTVAADWDDVDAAVSVAIARNETAIVRRTEAPPDRIEFEMITARDYPVRLIVTRDAEGAAGSTGSEDDQSPRITVRAAVGRFGDLERQRRIVDDVIQRLEELRGVDFAPIGAAR